MKQSLQVRPRNGKQGFRKESELAWRKTLDPLFSLTSNRNVASPSIMSGGNTALWNQQHLGHCHSSFVRHCRCKVPFMLITAHNCRCYDVPSDLVMGGILRKKKNHTFQYFFPSLKNTFYDVSFVILHVFFLNI